MKLFVKLEPLKEGRVQGESWGKERGIVQDPKGKSDQWKNGTLETRDEVPFRAYPVSLVPLPRNAAARMWATDE